MLFGISFLFLPFSFLLLEPMWGWVDEGWAFPGVAPAGTSRVRVPGRGIEVVRSGAVDSVQSSTCSHTASSLSFLWFTRTVSLPLSLPRAHTTALLRVGDSSPGRRGCWRRVRSAQSSPGLGSARSVGLSGDTGVVSRTG